MKKPITVLLGVVMAVALLAGCGNAKTETNAPAAEVKTESQSSESQEAESTEAESEESTSASAETEAAEESFTVIDAMGREVTIPGAEGSLSKAIIINRYDLELMRASGRIDKVVGVDESIIENSVYWPEFQPEQSIGNQQEPNFETIAEMEPDVVVSAFVDDALTNALEPFGIPVVAVIGYDTDLDKQMDILDKLFGETEKGNELRAFYTEVRGTIEEIAAGIKEEDRKTAIWESIKEYSVVTGGNAWLDMMLKAGVKDPLEGIDFSNSEIDAEAMINAEADVMFKMIAGSGLDLSGYTAPSDEDYKAAADAYTSRPGFTSVKAVENGDVYFVTSFCFGGMAKWIGSGYVGKLVYPEYYQNFDPDEMFAKWLTEFQNIDAVTGHCVRLGDME